MTKFYNLKHLQQFLERNATQVFNDKKIESILAKTMSQAVYDVVYSKYMPVEYRRRRNDGGLSDVRNMKITKVEVKNGKVTVLFENLTKGQTHYSPIYTYSADSKNGEFITDVINDGYQQQGDWYRQGRWSEARPFVQRTIEMIEANPSYLIGAIKSSYRKLGFQVK